MTWFIILIVGIGIGTAIYWGLVWIAEAINRLADAIARHK
jgi:hypothetical protein